MQVWSRSQAGESSHKQMSCRNSQREYLFSLDDGLHSPIACCQLVTACTHVVFMPRVSHPRITAVLFVT